MEILYLFGLLVSFVAIMMIAKRSEEKKGFKSRSYLNKLNKLKADNKTHDALNDHSALAKVRRNWDKAIKNSKYENYEEDESSNYYI